MDFLRMLPGATAQGLIWGLVAIGVYISFKILDIPDMTVDGSICTGACVFAVAYSAGAPIWLCMLLAALSGAGAGVVTGVIHTVFGVPAILSGILTQLMLYSVNVWVLDGASMAKLPFGSEVLLSASDTTRAIITVTLIIAALIIGLWLFFYTEIGLTLKSTGDNPNMSRAQGVNVNLNKVIGLALSNSIVALAGSLYVQYYNSMSLDAGSGTIVIGLAAIFIGLSVSLKIKPNFVVSLIGVVGGSIVYYIIFSVAMLVGLDTNFIKLFSASVVVLFVGIPYVKKTYFYKQKALPIHQANEAMGGDQNA